MHVSKIRRLAAAVCVAPIVAIGASAGVASAATTHASSSVVTTAPDKAGWGGGWGWGHGGGWGHHHGGWGWGHGGGWGWGGR